MSKTKETLLSSITFDGFKEKLLNDYKTIVLSRECSLLGRKEVLTGKAKFGIFGDGKELPQLVLSHFFQHGDFRAGYYRDQTLLMAQKLLSFLAACGGAKLSPLMIWCWYRAPITGLLGILKSWMMLLAGKQTVH